MANGVKVKGVLLQYGDGQFPENFTTVARLDSINPLSMSRDTIDTTSLDDPDDFRRFCGGLVDAGEVTFDLKFDPNEVTHSDAQGIIGQIDDGANRNYRVVFPSSPGVTLTLNGFVSSVSINGDIADVFRSSITIKISGKPIFA